MEKLHPGFKWYSRVGGWFLALFFTVFFIFFAVLPAGKLFRAIFGTYGAIVVPSLIFFFGIIILNEIYIPLAYANWKYELTKEAIKIEHGVIFKAYKSIPYDRIQNVDIHRGIVARIMGFSTVMFQTAGGARPGAEGSLPAISMQKAEQIRDMAMKKMRKHKSGL